MCKRDPAGSRFRRVVVASVAHRPDPCFTPRLPCRGRRHRGPAMPGIPWWDATISVRATSHREYNMPLYECVLIARNDVTQQQVEGVADNIASQLEIEGGAVKKREYWGLRGLAYRIKKN